MNEVTRLLFPEPAKEQSPAEPQAVQLQSSGLLGCLAISALRRLTHLHLRAWGPVVS